MTNIVANEESDPKSELKFLSYSAHDWTVAQHLLFLDAKNGNFTYLPYASQIIYELHSTENCQEESCYWVEVFYNGRH